MTKKKVPNLGDIVSASHDENLTPEELAVLVGAVEEVMSTPIPATAEERIKALPYRMGPKVANALIRKEPKLPRLMMEKDMPGAVRLIYKTIKRYRSSLHIDQDGRHSTEYPEVSTEWIAFVIYEALYWMKGHTPIYNIAQEFVGFSRGRL